METRRQPRQEYLARGDGDHRQSRRRRASRRPRRLESRTESRGRAERSRHRRHDRRACAASTSCSNKEIEVLTVQQEINTQARADIDRSQREFYLRQQLKAIQTELGEGNELAEEIEQYREKIASVQDAEARRGRGAAAAEEARANASGRGRDGDAAQLARDYDRPAVVEGVEGQSRSEKGRRRFSTRTTTASKRSRSASSRRSPSAS